MGLAVHLSRPPSPLFCVFPTSRLACLGGGTKLDARVCYVGRVAISQLGRSGSSGSWVLVDVPLAVWGDSTPDAYLSMQGGQFLRCIQKRVSLALVRTVVLHWIRTGLIQLVVWCLAERSSSAAIFNTLKGTKLRLRGKPTPNPQPQRQSKPWFSRQPRRLFPLHFLPLGFHPGMGSFQVAPSSPCDHGPPFGVPSWCSPLFFYVVSMRHLDAYLPACPSATLRAEGGLYRDRNGVRDER